MQLLERIQAELLSFPVLRMMTNTTQRTMMSKKKTVNKQFVPEMRSIDIRWANFSIKLFNGH
jgi:hypothetical protein